MQQQWSAVDNYLIKALIPSDPVLDRVLENNHRAGLPAHDVAANQGQFLALLVRITQAKRILEIGTLGGYSTIWMARELPADGQLLTLEADAHHAQVAAGRICSWRALTSGSRYGGTAATVPGGGLANVPAFDLNLHRCR